MGGEREQTDADGIEIVLDRRDAGFVIVNKPSGLLSVPGRGAETDPSKADCVIARVRSAFPDARGPMVIHRLDMDTSGLMAVATTADAQRELSVAFAERRVEKSYEALLLARGAEHAESLRATDGTIDAPMRLDVDRRPYQVFDAHRGKPSVTRWRAIDRDTGGAGLPGALSDLRDRVVRVRFEPVTGRSHQLRVHATLDERHGGLGAPILGDPLYHAGVGVAHADLRVDRPSDRAMSAEHASAGRLMLHACSLSLVGVHAESEAPF